VAGLWSVSMPAAQAAEPQDDSAQDEKVIVTGTRLKKVDISNLTPIISISREDIDKQGLASVKDVIDGLTQNTGGTFDNSFTFGFVPGASSVNLRGVGFGHTLVLIDGRRLPIYPIGIGGTDNFVDLSAIPMAFVERIDVLTDGASAVYGSDAVSGVINVITRKDIEGVTINYRFADTTDGGYQNQRFNLLTGARNGDTQIDLILDYWDQKALMATDRDYAASDVANPAGHYSIGGASFIGLLSGTVYQDPNCGSSAGALQGAGIPNVNVPVFSPTDSWCGYDRTPHRQLIAPQQRLSLMSRLSYEMTSDLSLFGRIGFSQSQTHVVAEPNFYGGGLFTGFGDTVPNNGGLVMAGAPNNPTTGSAFEEPGVYVRRLVEFGDRRSDIDDNSANLLLGLEGQLGHGLYEWELGISYNRTRLQTDANNILLSGLNRAVEDGLDLFQPIPQGVVESLGFNADRRSQSTNRAFDFAMTGDTPLELEGGPVQFAVAVEHVRESYDDTPDPLIMRGDAFDGASAGSGTRTHIGLGAELSFPFNERFEMDLALRWDDYRDDSDVGNAVSPRVAAAYQWNDDLLTRFSWGKSFRAPDMQRLFGAPTRGFTDIVDPAILEDSNGQPCTDPVNNPDCRPRFVESVNLQIDSNLDLEEEKGENLNLGVVWSPTKSFSLSADLYRIHLNNIVREVSPQSIVNICFELNLLCDLVQRDSNGTLSGSDAFIISFPLNFAENTTSGIDFSVDYRWHSELGQWHLQSSATWVHEFKTKIVAGADESDQIDQGFKPEWRLNAMLEWSKEDWGALVKWSYVDSIAGFFCVDCRSDQFIDSWHKVDANVHWLVNDYAKLRLGANNLFNEPPPTDPTQANWPWFPLGGGYYSAVGREVFVQLDVNF